MKSLVIVESPTKAKTISRFLGDGYEIIASMGHIMDLPKSTLGIEIDKDFKPDYQMMADKKKIISVLKSAGKTSENIILATDPDREGEAIAKHIKDILQEQSSGSAQSKKTKNKGLPAGRQERKFQRVVFHEITKEAIDEAFKNPRDIDENLVDAQTARRVLDRLVGYKLSPILWQKVRRGLSAGRVQSVALRLIVEREREIEKFKKEKYWTIHAFVAKDQKETEFDLIEIKGDRIELQEKFDLYDGQYKVSKTSVNSLDKAKQVISGVTGQKLAVADVLKKESRRSPGPAFTTSTLQQDASRRFGFSGKRTMSLAQKLYEEGFITYHRTDSVSMSSSAVFSFRSYVEKTYGKNYIPEAPRFYKTKQKLAQEAHEAVRPTNVQVFENNVYQELGRDYAKLYGLIWKRAVSSQMSDAVVEMTTVMADTEDKVYRFKANGSVLVFDGFLKVNAQGLSDNILPDFKTGEELDTQRIIEEEHETPPPPRYNDASIIATLEEKGIGRPSTYATIISRIETRQYIERQEGKIIPTSVGIAVNDFLVQNFSTIDDIPFTAEMENRLDQIASGEKKWVSVIKDFYTPFEKTLGDVKTAARVKIEGEKTDEICPNDGGHLVIRIGRFGKFLACENFPNCKFTKQFVQETNLTCPKDGGKIILKKTKKGRRFYGCSNYPACDFASWTKPTPEHVERSEIPNGNNHQEKMEDIKNPKEPVSKDKTS